MRWLSAVAFDLEPTSTRLVAACPRMWWKAGQVTCYDQPGTDAVMAEQIAYYRAVAAEYDSHCLRAPGGEELVQAIASFQPEGSVLELACGLGRWTAELLRYATEVTAVDAAPEMLAFASEHLGREPRVRFVQADVFDWRPEARFKVVFFGFLLSHVPEEHFDAFWSLVANSLAPGGRVLFVDDGYRDPHELVYGEASVVIERRLNDGTAYRIIKVPLEPASLEARLRRMGWDIAIRATSGPFLWGTGTLLG
jgi:SAM-dependent methyltransferase